MCGISGIYSLKITEQHHSLIQDIIKSQMRRGPDHQAALVIRGRESEVLFGHNRLSIIDLSEQANQPLWDASRRFCIVYNGEIYNYLELRQKLKAAGLQFNTQSDTEVILNAFAYWGIEALQYFQGPFAFALWDSQEERLWLCRDRFGVKPLYYIQKNQVLYFASTTPALARALNLTPNYSYLAQGLQYLVYEDNSDRSPYEGLQALPAGCYLSARFNSKRQFTHSIHSYYDLESRVQNRIEQLPVGGKGAMLALLTHQFEQAVQVRLRTDVPLAISLSGGLDSSSVASAVSRLHKNTIGFSFSHPLNKATEGPFVADCARFINIQMDYVWPSEHEIIEALPETIAAQDAPFTSLSMVAQYLLYKQVRARGIKVLLGGQGGDEAFMGYKKYLFFWIKQLLHEKRYFSSAKQLLQMLPMLFSEISALSSYWQHRHRYFGEKHSSDSALVLPESPFLSLKQNGRHLWQRQMQDIRHFSLPSLLRYEDRNSMAHSVESRLPYMDHHLIELGLALPESLKLRSGYGKWILREMTKNKIPESIRLARFKRGFDLSLKPLLEKGLGRSIRAQLQASPNLLKDFLKNSVNIDSLFSDQRFLKRQQTMREAITLLWLNKVLI